MVKSKFNYDGAHYLKDNNYFLMGTYCNVDGIDSYLVHANNETGEVTAVEVGDRCSIKLADSIEELLMTMKGKNIDNYISESEAFDILNQLNSAESLISQDSNVAMIRAGYQK